ncbi:Xaa-Pro peptidase family protein [Bradyrhizobium sp. LHD-71]|uniref:M24 family metallopeptidase n=1 Tax=Bradyrhizobium sp. LHD-71 TaxID=3072141 RepID=UPI00280DAFCE|nr:Xaa-Pro peptidase family protein [Bradyrhizobium sp. LHD-71]MDQ8728297.1 Xaa-Pro peptidase family protein [Bradyrhizobium sp. LHD-71]
MSITPADIRGPVPFDTDHLDRLLDEAGIDALVVTSQHNVQYLLGGYRFFFFDTMDAVGISRYLPALVYRKGRPEQAAYFGYAAETDERDLGKFWPANLNFAEIGSQQTMRHALAHIRKLDGVRRIGVEAAFLPTDAGDVLRRGLPNCDLVDAVLPLERLRACKTAEEIAHLREASEQVVASMLATFARCQPGMTKLEIAETLRREEVIRGLVFDYCLLTAGTSLNRAPSGQRLVQGDIISLDSGGNYKGYIGDLCRMGIVGTEPDAELEELLGFVEDMQQAARKVVRPGARGGDVIEVAERMLNASPHRKYTHYMAHGMGLVTHEAPRLINSTRMSYEAHDAERPLESGMVVSIETTMSHPKRGFIKLEDTILVTDDGHESLGDGGRGWNVNH